MLLLRRWFLFYHLSSCCSAVFCPYSIIGLNFAQEKTANFWILNWMQLVLLGDSGVGKSCIVLRFVRGQFDATSKVSKTLLSSNCLHWPSDTFLEHCGLWYVECEWLLEDSYLHWISKQLVMYQVTVGASFLSQTIALQDSTTVKFEIWDTAGQERC